MREPPAARLARLSWERIQLIIALRPEPPSDFAPEQLRLARGDRPGETLLPVRSRREAETIVARFNVMLGPEKVPLEPGSRWVLAVAGGSAGWPATPLPLEGSVDPQRDGRSFLVRRGRYEVRPAWRPTDGALELTVRLDRSASARSAMSVRERIGALLGRARSRGRVIAFRLAIGLMELLDRRNGHRILFMSDYSRELTDNLKLVYDRMVQRGLHREVELMTLTRPGLHAGRGLTGRLRLPWLLARADTVVIDKDQPVLHRGATRHRIIQLWHASGAIKTVGYSRIGTPLGPDPWSSTHKDYTYAIVSGEHDVPLYAEAFGIPEERVIPTGIPRMDRFFDERARAAGRESTLAAFPQARGRMVILFAPTFRGLLREATYDLGRLDLARLHALCLEKDAVFIIRLHPLVRGRPEIPPAFRDRLLDGSSTVMGAPDLLFATDLLITDYSSIVFEYATLGRPMLFFAYDLDEYTAERDVYVPYEEFVPGRIVRTFDELVEAIRRDDYEAEKVAPFAARHFTHRDGRATDRVIELIISR